VPKKLAKFAKSHIVHPDNTEDVNMPNGHDYLKEYGPHQYRDDGMGKCQNGCGCYMASAHSGGPIGLDPFGECPNNPKNGNLFGGNADHEIVVERRIRRLSSELSSAQAELYSTKKLVGQSVLSVSRKLKRSRENEKRLKDKLLKIRKATKLT